MKKRGLRERPELDPCARALHETLLSQPDQGMPVSYPFQGMAAIEELLDFAIADAHYAPRVSNARHWSSGQFLLDTLH
jgi:hypothetical protein